MSDHRYSVMCGHCGRLKHFARGDWRHPWVSADFCGLKAMKHPAKIEGPKEQP